MSTNKNKTNWFLILYGMIMYNLGYWIAYYLVKLGYIKLWQ